MPVNLSIQELQENKAYLDEFKKISSVKYLPVKAQFGNQPPSGMRWVMGGDLTCFIINRYYIKH